MNPRSQNKLTPNPFRLPGIITLMLVFLVSSGCSSWKKEEVDTELLSAETLYGQAKEALLNENWSEAITALQKLEARYPYGRFAKQAQLETAFAYYKNGDEGLAIAAADRFISLNPTHASVDYAYYIKGLASFNEKTGFVGLITGRNNLADRDPQAIVEALAAFKTIVERYPDSRYVRDSVNRINYLESARAQHQISIAHYYYARGAYVAAINRAKTVVSQYSEFPQVEDALGIMYYSYQQMQINDLAQDARRVLELNYPNSGYLKTSKPKKGWLGNLFNS